LETLSLASNSLQYLYEVVELPNLLRLDCSHNTILSLSSTALETPTQDSVDVFLPRLEVLSLSHNQITSEALPKLGLHLLTGSLRELDLTGNQLGRMEPVLFELGSLEVLRLGSNELRAVRRGQLPRLRELDLSNNRLKEVDGLQLPSLTFLNLAGNRISSCAAVKALSQLAPVLEELWLGGNPVTGRRVYTEFLQRHGPKRLERLDGEPMGGREGSGRRRSLSASAHYPLAGSIGSGGGSGVVVTRRIGATGEAMEGICLFPTEHWPVQLAIQAQKRSGKGRCDSVFKESALSLEQSFSATSSNILSLSRGLSLAGVNGIVETPSALSTPTTNPSTGQRPVLFPTGLASTGYPTALVRMRSTPALATRLSVKGKGIGR